MASTFKFELVSPERILMSGDAEQVLLPGAEGDMTILPGHAPVVSTLRPGILDIVLAGSRSRIYVKSGFAEVSAERVTVLADQAHDVADLAPGDIARELEAAEAELAAAADDEARFMASEAVSLLSRMRAN
ncbi:MAG: F0F1 ATP synthase subunit epsilon [Hyphomicrobium sp.]